MTRLTLEQLRQTVTPDEALDSIISDLQDLGFPATSWQPGSTVRTILEVVARRESERSFWVARISEGMFMSSSAGPALDDRAVSSYDYDRKPAIPTQGYIHMSASAGAGPYSWTVGDLIVQDDKFGLTYTNVTTGSLALQGTGSFLFEADISGSQGNVASNTITSFVQGLASVTVTNPPLVTSGTWITQAGINQESDGAYRRRCQTRWTSLPYATTAEGYENIVLNVPGVAKAKAQAGNPRGPGSINVYVFGQGSTVGETVLSASQAAIDARKPITADPKALDAQSRVINVSATITHASTVSSGSLLSAISGSLVSYLNPLPIGGKVINGTGYVVRSKMIDAIQSIPGVENVDLTSPASDPVIEKYEAAVLGSISGITFVQNAD